MCEFITVALFTQKGVSYLCQSEESLQTCLGFPNEHLSPLNVERKFQAARDQRNQDQLLPDASILSVFILLRYTWADKVSPDLLGNN